MDYTTSEKLEVIMRRKSVSVTELANRIGQSRQNVSIKFSKNNFTENELKLISAALDIDYRIEFEERGK